MPLSNGESSDSFDLISLIGCLVFRGISMTLAGRINTCKKRLKVWKRVVVKSVCDQFSDQTLTKWSQTKFSVTLAED